MSSNSEGGRSTEAHTDPMLPRITDDMLPPLERPVVPRLDDRALAEMLAELDGEDEYPVSDGPGSGRPMAGGRVSGRSDTPSPRSAPAGESTAGPGEPVRPSRPEQLAEMPSPRPRSDSAAPTGTHGDPAPDGDAESEEPSAEQPDDQPEPEHTTIRQSAAGPVVHSRYGDFRPPIERSPDGPSLTGFGLTRRSRSRIGSVLFTVVFVAIFLLILIQAVASMISDAGSP